MNFEISDLDVPRPYTISRALRRWGVVLNYASLTVCLACLHLVKSTGFRPIPAGAGAAALAFLVLSFVRLHWKTGLWRLTHSGTDGLDERQNQVAHEALRISYSGFSVISLSVLLLLSLLREDFPLFDRVSLIGLTASLLYFAHTLPGSVLAWRETEI